MNNKLNNIKILTPYLWGPYDLLQVRFLQSVYHRANCTPRASALKAEVANESPDLPNTSTFQLNNLWSFVNKLGE